MKREEYRLHLDNIFNSIEDAILAVDRDSVVTEANEAAKNVCGFDKESIGKDLRLLEFGCERKCLLALNETIERAQSVKARRFECRRKQNPPKVINLSTYPLLDHRGMVTGGVMTSRDEARIAGVEADFSERRTLHNLVGKSRQMQRIYSLVERLADVDSNVLISGESGTGKELVAKAIHHLGHAKQASRQS